MQKKIYGDSRTIRPLFKDVSPLVSKMILIFGWGNVLMGLGLIAFQVRLANLLIINGFMTYRVWGVVFMSLGLFMLIAYLRNEWTWMRRALFVGIIIKVFWMIGLVLRYASGDQPNIIVPTVWAMLTLIQIAAYVHFLPGEKKVKHNGGKAS